MFDSMGAFTKQFAPTDGGYLYYPSRKIGGKLVTAEEYATLVRSWEGVAGRGGRWKVVGAVFLSIVLWSVAETVFALPEWWTSIFITGCVLAVSSWILWASLAPRRLVKDRPAVTPPRDISEARQQARAMLNWPFVVFALVISGAIFFGSILSPKDTLTSWSWLIGSGVMFVAYIWIAIQKLRDK